LGVPFSSKYVGIDGVAVHYLHTPPTSLPDVPPPLADGALFLFVHGVGRNAGDFRRQLAGLSGRHSVVVPDLPGHGRSAGLDGLPTVEAYADFVDRFAAAVCRRPLVLVGSCLGADAAVAVAARRPGRLAGLVLLSAGWRPDAGLVDRIRDVVRGRLPQQFDTSAFSPSTPMDVMREWWMEQVKTDPRVLHGDLAAAAGFDAGALASDVRLPTLVVHGADDQLADVDAARALAGAVAGARLEVVAAAGHAVHMEQAERVNALVADFASGLRA
jgi:(E)-2-((N-methylformamido)methylene)succinate hydrolase